MNFEYCELWYFTLEGCQVAQDSLPTSSEDTFAITMTKGLATLHPVASVQASGRAVKDENLTWVQFLHAQHGFIQHISKYGWPSSHVQALSRFFAELQSCAYLARSNGKHVVLAYQARVRREWMDSFKRDRDSVFDIGLINYELMESIGREIQARTTASLQCE
ncbi:hypothetical protein DXG01_011222, partial [Tephrocybe rancida]